MFCGGLLKGGTLTWVVRDPSLISTVAALHERLIWNIAGGKRMTCTLLGPEGPGFAAARESGERERTSGPRRVSPVGERAGYRPYFENYTVDASILDPRPSGFGSHR